MLNAIPVIGHIIALILTISMAIPFWIVWTLCGIGAKFFGWLPAVYLTPGFWECVGVFMVVSILKVVLVPRLVSAEPVAAAAARCA